MDDSSIVALFLKRDETAIEQSREKYGRRLYALALGITADAPTAEECESDTYLQAWTLIPPHEPRTYLYAFLARLTRHISMNRVRERKSLKRSACLCELSTELEQCLPSGESMERYLDELALKEALNGFLATLSEEKRTIFLRRYWFLDSVEAISGRLCISQSKVKTTLFRCRKALKSYLEKEGYEV